VIHHTVETSHVSQVQLGEEQRRLDLDEFFNIDRKPQIYIHEHIRERGRCRWKGGNKEKEEVEKEEVVTAVTVASITQLHKQLIYSFINYQNPNAKKKHTVER
jgi:hypothetical protein